ncbi:MAG: hypothetical protein EA423_09190 [Phycisphaerales bacterium]|nr:MAG: hypothetical protein EA423_09190 [Phycisphaerales bacterium]
MNPIVLGVALWLLLGLEVGLRDLLAIGAWSIGPSLVIPLVVFVALAAPAKAALWFALFAGLARDLVTVVSLDGGGATVIVGPGVIGTMLGAQLVLSARGLVMKRNPVTLAILSVGAAGVSDIVRVAALTVRNAYDPIVWSAGERLGAALLSAVYTGVAGLALALVLLPLAPLFGSAMSAELHGRGSGGRRG